VDHEGDIILFQQFLVIENLTKLLKVDDMLDQLRYRKRRRR